MERFAGYRPGMMLTLLLLVLPLFAQQPRFIDRRKEIIRNDTSFYFYHKELHHGVQDLYNPAYVIVNGGYDVLQQQGYSRVFTDFDWRLNTRNVFDNLINPFPAIKEVGWGDFIVSEVLPLNYTPSGSQWIPNYFLHIMGSGMEYRMLTEYYRAYRVPVPKLFSTLTVLGMQFLNEVIENKDREGTNADPIPDWYIFNVAGILIFNSTKVSRFMSERMNMADWSYMPTVSFKDFSLQNSGQYFIYKVYFRRHPDWAVFSRWGMGTQLGITRKFRNENALTLAAGVKPHEYKLVSEAGKVSTTTLTWAVFTAWDKNNTPLMTFQYSGNEDYSALLNIYPGVIRIKKFSPGLWAAAGTDGTGAFGICAKYTLGLGVGYGW